MFSANSLAPSLAPGPYFLFQGVPKAESRQHSRRQQTAAIRKTMRTSKGESAADPIFIHHPDVPHGHIMDHLNFRCPQAGQQLRKHTGTIFTRKAMFL
ncbi:hypothetical protein JZ751_012029 [Albula glossodonta]|uniref:Uncharacterized protein n=1 Tax=Albula glossodonta TaxID=121402 RepID=A0A8T2PRC1_9TELE|nr:hypothetical protein JZ751_012029 [Albula glossodonta]